MSDQISLSDWQDFLRQEYLSEFVTAGGAALKFAISSHECPSSLIVDRLVGLANSQSLTSFVVDSMSTRVDCIDKIFNACATQVPWDRLTEYILRSLAADMGFTVPSDLSPTDSFADRVARASSTDPIQVKQTMRSALTQNVLRDPRMVREFRQAMMWMCNGRMLGSLQANADADAIRRWLDGTSVRVAEMKQFGIYSRINRSNGRLHLESLMHWLRVAKLPGSMVIINLDQLVTPSPSGLRYSRIALLDAYEVLRQFIDEIDEMEGTLIVAVAGEAILDPDRRGRGFGAYHALRNRVYDEVRDRSHANPAGSLVRLVGARR